MPSELIEQIKNCGLFHLVEFDDETIELLSREVDHIVLNDEEILFNQGEDSNCFYILAKGKLFAYLTEDSSQKKRLVGHIYPGEMVGELGAISGERRSLTVQAVEPSSLFKLSSALFAKLCARYPAIYTQAIQLLVQRSQKVIELLSAKNMKEYIAIIPVNKHVSLTKFEENLKSVIETSNDICLISDIDDHSNSEKSQSLLEKRITEAENQYKFIVYLLKSHETPLAKKCLSNVKKIYIVANGNTVPNFSDFALKTIRNKNNFIDIPHDLILTYSQNEQPRNTLNWITTEDFHKHHKLRDDNVLDYQRLLRFLKGNPIGLVLSGGGSKGLAHLGVLKALLDAGIPIDVIGGTSAGACVGALYAMHQDYEKVHHDFNGIVSNIEKIPTLKNICWPAISIYNCRKSTDETRRLFGENQIEDLWIPFFCISCNISLYKEHVHTQGLLWESVRATVALPGIVAPMVINGELHVDGGLINNLPVNIMRSLLGKSAKIIAVDLFSNVVDAKKYHFNPGISFFEAFCSKFGISYQSNKFPSFLDFFIKSLLIGSSVKQHENGNNADILIQPNTTGINMLKLKSQKEKDDLFALGYSAAVSKMKDNNIK